MEEYLRLMYRPQIGEINLIYKWLAEHDAARMSTVETPKIYGIRVPLVRQDERVAYLSITIPPDAMGNRGSDPEHYPVAIETALINSDNDLIYIPEWGYSDIHRFYGKERASEVRNCNDLLNEIRRLEKENPGNPDAVDSDNADDSD